jgi:crotonobetainyl-CoA:carnitine CoA-transferase CaiB-like acyl-CoA transferase
MTSFLNAVRVLDFGQFLPGPYCAQILADMGAEVIKLEAPAGDPMRGFGPSGQDGLSLFYQGINAGKTVVAVDLKSESGKRDFKALISQADVLIESFRPGVLERLGFSRTILNGLNPRLVHCALSGFGQNGPYRQRSGHDINYMALAGGLAASGTRERPVMTAPPVADFASGSQAATAIVAALFGRERSGKGSHLDMSISESVLSWQGMNLTAAGSESHHPERAGNILNGGYACYQIYQTGDDSFISLGAIEPKFWANFCTALDQPAWIVRQNEDAPQESLIAEVAKTIAGKVLAHWESLLDPVDCCFHALIDPDNLSRHPQILERRMLHEDPVEPGLVHALYPAWINHQPPRPRLPVKTADCSEILESWATGR